MLGCERRAPHSRYGFARQRAVRMVGTLFVPCKHSSSTTQDQNYNSRIVQSQLLVRARCWCE